MELVEIGKNILTSCMNVRPKEQVLVVTDDEKYAIGQALYQAAKVLGSEAMLMTMSPRVHPLPTPGPKSRLRRRERGLPRCQVSQKICLPRVL